MVKGFNLTKSELTEAAKPLQAVTPAVIAEAVARPPDSWKISMEERLEMVRYLFRRKGELMASMAAL